MSFISSFNFTKISSPTRGAFVFVVHEGEEIGALAQDAEQSALLDAAGKAAKFTGKNKSKIDLFAPFGFGPRRVIILGAGKKDENEPIDWMNLGGMACAMLSAEDNVGIQFDCDAHAAAAFAHGYALRAYKFDKYKTKKSDEEKNKPTTQSVTIMLDDVSGAKTAWAIHETIAQGTMLARDLVNEPPNVLTPIEFAKRAEALSTLGVETETLDEKAMKKLGMGALLGVALGSRNAPRMVIMKWNGGEAKDQPVAFVGKGVTFDTGGISLKPGAGMEDMKGDMGGAAAVTGLMHALASRKAKVNAIGIIGLVENMPDGNAQRPGDIVTSMSGQTIEIINTDAEGRLVLADALWYCKEQYKPQFMVNLATLTGAVLVALGQERAGLFSNNDALSQNLSSAGVASGEAVWRLPLGKAYDKMIDSKFADMKNTGGRYAGSITAAQFLQRFVGDTPWAHLDVAGTAMSSPSTDINTSWGSGYGVRLLNQLVADYYEKK